MVRLLKTNWQHRFVQVNAVRLHLVEAGSGPLVILLHDFPEFWFSWRHQISVLVAAGFRVMAADMRGYNLSEKPAGVDAYDLELLVADIGALIVHFGQPSAHVVGWGWGGQVTWFLAMWRPKLVRSLAIVNLPHPSVFVASLQCWRHRWMLWHAYLLQTPWFGERMLAWNRCWAIRHVLSTQTVRPVFTPSDLQAYVNAAEQPGALAAALNYYRAIFRRSSFWDQRDLRVINSRVLLLWGQQNPYFSPDLAEPSQEWVPRYQLMRLRGGGQWAPLEDPEEFNSALITFLNETG